MRVYSRKQENREAFCRRMSERLGIEVAPAQRPEQVVQEADIVITVTNSIVPVLLGDWLVRPGLVVAAGANHWYKREIDERVVERAALIVVDQKEQARVEAGNLLWAIAHGLLTWDRVKELGDVVTGAVPVPDFSESTILFESHGLAINDVAIASKTYELALAEGIGSKINL